MNRIITATGITAALALGTALSSATAASASTASKPVVYSGYSGWQSSGHLPHRIALYRYRGHVEASFRVKHWTFNNQGGAHNNWLAYAAHASLVELESDGRWHTHRGYLDATVVRSHDGTRYYKHLDLITGNGSDWAYSFSGSNWHIR